MLQIPFLINFNFLKEKKACGKYLPFATSSILTGQHFLLQQMDQHVLLQQSDFYYYVTIESMSKLISLL